MELLMKYSGITAIIVYSFVLFLILKFRKKKEAIDNCDIPANKVISHDRLDLSDIDASIACLVAAIECREEYHKNVEVIGVRRIG